MRKQKGVSFSSLFAENCGINTVEREEENRVVRAAIAELPSAMMVALLMRFARVYTLAQISATTGIPESSVRTATDSAAHYVKNRCTYEYAKLAEADVKLPPLDELDVEEFAELANAG